MTHFELIIKLGVVCLILLLFGNCSVNKNKSTFELSQKSKQDSLAFELCKIYGLDQGIRDMKIMKSPAFRMSPHVDSVSFYKLLNFVKENGTPTEKLLGKDNYSHECVQMAHVAVLLHTPHMLINNKEYLDVFLVEVKKGNMSIKFLADILDKHYWVRRDEFGNKKLLYGSQFGKPCRMYQKESDSARAVIGLSPLADSSFIDCKTE